MNELVFDSSKISYNIKYSSKRKTIAIQIDPVKGLIILAPKGTPIEEIHKVLQVKEDWITTKIEKSKEILPAPKSKEFVSGERLDYIGRSYRLQICKEISKNIRFTFYRGKFLVYSSGDNREYSNKIRKKVISWYREHALVKLKERVEFYAPKVGKFPKEVRVKEFKARWGTTQDNGILDFNWKIILAPMSIIDFVVVHELCHLVTLRHSKEFWSKLSAIIVDHKERDEWLRINGATLTL